MSRRLRVVVVDDQNLVRQGIRGLLELSDAVDVIGEASDGAEALDAIEALDPDVALLDLRMPGMGGIEVLEALRERGSDVPALVLTTFDDAELVLTAMRAGARGYLLKDVTLDQLVDAIGTVANGGTVLQPALTDRLVRESAPAADAQAIDVALTGREADVLRLVAGGFNNREIAEMLHLAEGTVKNHVSNAIAKLGARDRTQAVLRALHRGLLAGS
ncbi:response regulator [Microbacterium sp. JB110]|uniref:response regulator n=1 Tax=Microbacterium sp. JB110 TaxID=2024477 RepID=UPI00097F2FB7|nr:response regulator transcription factor [Microbacterium sp. JB110]RCS60527.1 DNA-binding response regulator [Microbacterium sp. JB110]SJM46490.1 Two-component system regulatory protein [Frigoribacterium sp. JB110]